jgi:hypothetical protein
MVGLLVGLPMPVGASVNLSIIFSGRLAAAGS